MNPDAAKYEKKILTGVKRLESKSSMASCPLGGMWQILSSLGQRVWCLLEPDGRVWIAALPLSLATLACYSLSLRFLTYKMSTKPVSTS